MFDQIKRLTGHVRLYGFGMALMMIPRFGMMGAATAALIAFVFQFAVPARGN